VMAITRFDMNDPPPGLQKPPGLQNLRMHRVIL
jgi:hypothetical protein